MDLENVERLVRLLENSNIEELEVEEEGLRVRIQKHSPNQGQGVQPIHYLAGAPPALTSPHLPTESGGQGSSGSVDDREDSPVIPAPMVGTFYRSAAPDADPYVEVGDTVTEETIVCIVEAMKVMNEIKAAIRGVITEVLVENAKPVEFGQPMFRVKPSGV